MDQVTIDRHMRVTRYLFAFVSLLSLLAFSTAAYRWFGLESYTTPDAWGQFGDYFGGVLNPVVGACTLYWLLISVRIQRVELSETRNALEKTQLAAEEQARLTLLTARIESINIRLAQLSGELDYRRQKRTVYVQLANRSGPVQDVITYSGRYEDPIKLIRIETTRIEELEQAGLAYVDQLNSVLHEAEKS